MVTTLFTFAWNVIPALAWSIQCFVKIIYLGLAVSVWIGEQIVLHLVGSSSKVYKRVSAVANGMVVMCEDFKYFASDIFGIFSFVYNAVETLLNSFIDAFTQIGNFIFMLINTTFNIKNVIFGMYCNCFETFTSSMHMCKEFLILIGSSIWLCVKIVPLFLLYLISLLLVLINRSTEEACSIVYSVFEFQVSVIKSITTFIVDTPLEAIFGLTIGLILLYAVHKNWFHIVDVGTDCFECVSDFLHDAILKGLMFMKIVFFRSIISIRNAAHEFRMRLASEQRMQDEAGDVDEKLCVICKDKEREIILLPCKHMCLCSSCLLRSVTHYRSLGQCPLCRQQIDSHIKVYL